jgi:hypothetical protein
MLLLPFGTSIGLSLVRDRDRIDAQARERLATQAKVISASLERRLDSVDRAMGAIRRSLPF